MYIGDTTMRLDTIINASQCDKVQTGLHNLQVSGQRGQSEIKQPYITSIHVYVSASRLQVQCK